jgi:hypothetical protein
MRAALSAEVVLCHMSRFVSREARDAAARLSRFTVWRFEALSGHNPCVWALAVRKPVRGASGYCIGGESVLRSRAWLCCWGASGGWQLRDTAIKCDGCHSCPVE